MNINDQYRDLIVEHFSTNEKKLYSSIFNSGRDALFSILSALKISENNEIIVQSYTCKSVIDVIKWFKAKPIFVDINSTYTLSIDELKKKITPQTKVIISQNTYGIEPELKRIEELCLENKIIHIQDLCQGYNETLNTINLIAFSSSHWNKVFNTFGGGYTLVQDKDLSNKILNIETLLNEHSKLSTFISYITNYSILKIRGTRLEKYISRTLYLYENIFNSDHQNSFCKKKMNKYQIEKGLLEVHHLDKNIHHRTAFSNELVSFLKLNNKIIPLEKDIPFTYFPIRTSNKKEFLMYASKENVLFYCWPLSPVSPITENLERWDIDLCDFPNSKKAIDETVLIYTSPEFPFSYQKKVLNFLTKYRYLVL